VTKAKIMLTAGIICLLSAYISLMIVFIVLSAMSALSANLAIGELILFFMLLALSLWLINKAEFYAAFPELSEKKHIK